MTEVQEAVRKAGFRSLSELQELALMPRSTLIDWYNKRQDRFNRLCEMALLLKNKRNNP